MAKMNIEIITGIIDQPLQCNIIWVYFALMFIFTAILLILRIKEVIWLRKQLKACQNALKRKLKAFRSEDV